jgi:hypothetical protein
MKKIGLGILLVIWMIFTLVLTFSLIGLVLLAPGDSWENHRHSTWMLVGRELLATLTK